jgi:hypothetical protein
MTIFKLDPEKYKAFKRKTFLRTIMLFPVYIIIAIAINISSGNDAGDSNILFYLILFLILSGVFSVYSNNKQLNKFEALYRLKIDNDKIIFHQFKFNDVQIGKDEITGIYALPNGSFRITTTDSKMTINTHPSIENAAELKTLLSHFSPIEPLKDFKKKVYLQYLMVVLVLLGMIAAFSINNPWIAVSGGLLSAGYLLYAFIIIQRNPVIGKDLKQKTWWFILPFLALLFAVFSKLVL